MTKPTILTVDDDPGVLASIARDLRARYGQDYRIVKASSGQQALDVLAELALRARPVALVTSDQRMPGMTGVQMLGRHRGDITIHLQPGETVLRVWLPGRHDG